MGTLFVILALVALFLLGVGVGVAGVLAVLVIASKEGDVALAIWSNKESRWNILGNYLSIATDINTRLRTNQSDSPAQDVHYI